MKDTDDKLDKIATLQQHTQTQAQTHSIYISTYLSNSIADILASTNHIT